MARSPKPPRSGPSPLAMIAAEVRALDVSIPALRKFGLAVGSVFVGIAVVIAWFKDWDVGTLTWMVGGLGATLVVLGALVPIVLRGTYKVWMGLAFAMGYVTTVTTLTVAYLLMVTPIGFVLRALGKDPLAKGPDPDLNSYWILRDDPAPSTKERLERYF